MKIVEIAFTGYPVSDMERARAFYEGLLKLEPSRVVANGHWVEYDLGPATFAISNTSQEWKPSGNGPAAAFEVDDFDLAVDALRAGNVKFVIEPFESAVCWMTIIADPDGNSIAIHKRKVG
jgi:predicted enzyme related to lactoylglutathione lyase